MSSDVSRLQSRAYQLEMYEEAMKRNIIVAMATGSGKTNVACLRIEAELQRTPKKRVWFTVPNTVLAEQQHYFLSSQLPQYQMRTLLGSDNVDRWRMQEVWDAALANMDVVVCTPQVLLDALRNAFVQLNTISLLVVDEAHHCQAGSPSARIMQEHYHPLKLRNPTAVPYVLGLTASIRISTKTESIEKLESNLDAVCRTPTLAAEEYDLYVHIPEILELTHTTAFHSHSELFNVLSDVVDATQISDDPYYQSLMKATDLSSTNKLQKVESKQITPALKDLKALRNNAKDLHQSLGPWASDDFIKSCIENWHQNVLENATFQESLVEQSMIFIDRRLSLVGNAMQSRDEFALSQVSPKALALIKLLAKEYHEGIAVIIFVERRSAAFALCRLLSAAPELSNYRIFSFVGLATSRSGSLVEVADKKVQKKAFADFRTGSQDICITTSVAEEGVDIQAVNLVIRYDDPKQFVSYLQSRGRARRQKSKFVYFRDTLEGKTNYKEWSIFEKKMEEEYKKEKDLREYAKAADDLDLEDNEIYTVSSTNAKLSFENSMQHLQHFCNVVAKGANPIYVLGGTPGIAVTAKVVLPSNIPVPLQQASAERTWYGEKAAKRDAAFRAYKALHIAGMVTENLVPHQPLPSRGQQAKHGTRLYNVSDEIEVWRSSDDSSKFFYYHINVCHEAEKYAGLVLALPTQLRIALSFELVESFERTLSVKVTPLDDFKLTDLHKAKSFTRNITEAVFYTGSALNSLEEPSRLPILLLPEEYPKDDAGMFGKIELFRFLEEHRPVLEKQPLLLWKEKSRKPYIWHPEHTPKDFEDLNKEIRANKLKKLQIYTQLRGENHTNAVSLSRNTLRVSECYARPAATVYGPCVTLIPSILHLMAAGLRAQYAQETVLKVIEFSDTGYLVQALLAKSASSLYNYERFEFLGDAYLKFRASLQVFASKPLATEGVLDISVSELTSNLRLERSTRSLGLEAYITTKTPSQKHWKLPQLAGNSPVTTTRKVASKTLADVVESILAAAYLDGFDESDSSERCTKLLQMFLPELDWNTPSQIAKLFLSDVVVDVPKGRLVHEVGQMLGYDFHNVTLLCEALTHSSSHPREQSLDRLEFLGDAIIDWILKARLFRNFSLDADRMTLCRHAAASHVFFAYSCLDVRCRRLQNEVEIISGRQTKVEQHETTLYATDLIRFHEVQLRRPIQAAREEFELLKVEIDSHLNNGVFPWTQLRRIDAPKVCSDVVESLIAAVYLDSGASLGDCEKLLDRLGILDVLDRMASNSNFELRTPAARLREYCDQNHLTVDICPADSEAKPLHIWKVVISSTKIERTLEYFGTQAKSKDEARSIAAEVALKALIDEAQANLDPNQHLSFTQDTIMTDISSKDGGSEIEDNEDNDDDDINKDGGR